MSKLLFETSTPLAPHGLGGLVRDHFSNGRIFATVGAHGGLLKLSYWGNQHLGARDFFRGDAESAWVKLMRVRLRIGTDCYYPELNETRLLPFGYTSCCELAKLRVNHQLLLLPDALVQRIEIKNAPEKLSVNMEMIHQESCTAIERSNRNWDEFSLDSDLGALVTCCRDENPQINRGGDALAQDGFGLEVHDAPSSTTWIAIACDVPMEAKRGYHRRSKYYLSRSGAVTHRAVFFTVFASSREELTRRIVDLRRNVHAECDALMQRYEKRLQMHPKIETGNHLLDSAFNQYPEIIAGLQLPDVPGAFRATQSGYFVWGWDGMTPTIASVLANEPEKTAAILRFMQKTLNPVIGIPHAFTSTFQPYAKGPFPAQAQFICGLYHHFAATGDMSLVREVMPTCEFILERCREREIRNSGLVSGHALWPDFPEAMEENGRDISSMNNSLLYQGLRVMEQLYALLGETAKADDCRSWAERLRVSFRKYLYDEEKGYFISSCSSEDFSPRKHYCCQAIFWLTPFARELVSHAPTRIARFMDEHLRSERCLLSLPHWDSAWMADGNQLGSSFPAADHFYLNVHNLAANPAGNPAWLGDLAWFWQFHTAPEAFTPEAENEEVLGPDNPGCKQLQALTTWYTGAFSGLAGLDFDHEGLTFNPCGDIPIRISGLKLREHVINLNVTGSGSHFSSFELDGRELGAACCKIAWDSLKPTAQIEIVRSEQVPAYPCILRADGLRVTQLEMDGKRLRCVIEGAMSGEVEVRTTSAAQITVDGRSAVCHFDHDTQMSIIPFSGRNAIRIEIQST